MAAGGGPPLPIDPVADRLIRLYDESEKKLERLITAALARGARGTARFYENQAKAVAAELARLTRESVKNEAPLIASAYGTGVGAIDRVLDRSGAFSGVHTSALEVLVANYKGKLAAGRDRVGREANDVFRRIAIRQTALDVATGRSPRDQQAGLEAALRREGITGFVDRAGRRWSLSTYAAMVTRTLTREAASVGMRNRMVEHGEDVAKISTHRYACPICLRYQGRTFSLHGRSPYPVLDKLPPFHPNCRHVLLPSGVNFEQMEKALGLGPPEGWPGYAEPVLSGTGR